jgi:U4/U6.U5 tri-snRNP-associated protein 1
MSQQETVIEISIEETNKLRQSLGLAPLRLNHNNHHHINSQDSNNHNNNTLSHAELPPAPTPVSAEVIAGATATTEEVSLSISETNNLRKSLGLPPLRETNATSELLKDYPGNDHGGDMLGRKSSLAIHKPAPNTHQEYIVQARIERARLEREIQMGIKKFEKDRRIVFESDENEMKSMDNLSWADLMRRNKSLGSIHKQDVISTGAPVKTIKQADGHDKSYKEDDMQEQNLMVSHNISDFQEGTTAILTLKDQTILEGDGNVGNDEAQMNVLENIDMTEQQVLKHNLKQKRLAEIGMGHAGGYTGYDDDEFLELGGNLHPQGSHVGIRKGGEDGTRVLQGFQILGKQSQLEDSNGPRGGKTKQSDLFASLQGKEISLESAITTDFFSRQQQDFMTVEEEEQELEQAMGIHAMVSSDKLQRKRKRKEKKAKKKLLKENQKDNKDDGQAMQVESKDQSSTNLLEQLEASSKNRNGKKRGKRMRRTNVDSDDSEQEDVDGGEEKAKQLLEDDKSNKTHDIHPIKGASDKDTDINDAAALYKKKEKYFNAVEKGNQRSRAVFGEHDTLDKNTSHPPAVAATEEPNEIITEDDTFLTAAISKARRLKRLRELQANTLASSNVPSASAGTTEVKGANAVVEALQELKNKGDENSWIRNADSTGNVTFELGTTKEFTQALRAQSIMEQDNRSQFDKDRTVGNKIKEDDKVMRQSPPNEVVQDDDEHMDDGSDHHSHLDTNDSTTLEELAQQVQEDNTHTNDSAFDSTGTTIGVGRGLSSFLGMLKKTGEIANNRKLAEELRGRAKDEKTYDDYAPLDLKKVVKIDDSVASKGGPYDKDIELANREVKLEYRDEHGRLLTRKEAYRQLCYQFHGHGSSKKKQEKRLQQIERERAEHSSQNAMDEGTLGALKATQKATGKAFVLHKM